MRKDKKYKHLFFDLDGTLTRSRTLIEPEIRDMVNKIADTKIVITGGKLAQIEKQLVGVNMDLKMPTNGNHAIEGGETLWENKLNEEEKEEIYRHLNYIEENRDWDVKDPNDLSEDRICQIAYSCLGFHEDVSLKEKFDPTGERRKEMLRQNPNKLISTEVKVAGTTTFDYIKKGWNKGGNVTKLIELKEWDKDDCLYFGDQLYEGGNDEAVIGIIDTQEVKNPADTLRILKEMYENSSN